MKGGDKLGGSEDSGHRGESAMQEDASGFFSMLVGSAVFLMVASMYLWSILNQESLMDMEGLRAFLESVMADLICL